MKMIITEQQYLNLVEMDLSEEKKYLNERFLIPLADLPETGQDAFGLYKYNRPTYKETPKTWVQKLNISLQIAAKKKELDILSKTKKNQNVFCQKNNSIKKPSANTGEIQDFLITVGLLKTKDWDFKNLSATAAGKFLYGSKSNINTVNLLWSKLKSEGYDVGPKPVFTNQMAAALSKKIKDRINQVKISCEKNLKNIDSKIVELKNVIKSLQNDYNSPNREYTDDQIY